MTPLFLYLLKSSISLAILVIFYEAFQKREAFFNFNRAYFLMGIGIVLLLPFLNFNFFSFILPATNSSEYLLTYQVSGYQLSEVTIGDGGVEQTSFSVIALLLYIYLAGVILRTAIVVFRTFQLFNLIKNARAAINDKIRIIFTDADLPVFSFFNNIFIAESTFYSLDVDDIIAHEKIHISQYHSLDLLFAELVCIVQWFNPFAYKLKKAIRENHEFIADRQVITNYTDPSKYRLLLLKYSSRIKTNSLAHNFSYLLLKRRLFMINKSKRPLRIGITIFSAIVAFGLIMFSCSVPEEDGALNVDKLNQVETTTVYMMKDVDTMSGFPGGRFGLATYLDKNLKLTEERKNGMASGVPIVNIIILEDGSVGQTKIVRGVGKEIDEEVLRVVSEMPMWTPAMLDGKPVKVTFDLPVGLMLSEKDEEKNLAYVRGTKDLKTDSIHTVVKQMPEFPGGMQALMEYLGSNIKYPEQAKRDSIQGRVFVQFVVEKDGSVSGAHILRGIGGGCDEEALRVVSSMPNWQPGLDENKEAVRVQYNIPIKYALN